MRLRKRRGGYNLEVDEIVADKGRATFLEQKLPGVIFRLFYIAVVAVSLAFAARVYYIGASQSSFYKERALANVNQEIAEPAPRGIIYDRFGEPIAQNQPVFSVSLKISEFVKNKKEITDFLRSSIGIAEEDLNNSIAKMDIEKSDAVVVARDLSPEDIIKLKTKTLAGIQIQDDFRRYYPRKDALSHVVGYADVEGKGRTGLELYYENKLEGVPGLELKIKNAKGEVLEDYESRPPKNGGDLKTTIDAAFGEYFYNRLGEGLKELGRVSGAGLAIDPRNGEILAVVSLPSYDDNLFAKSGTSEDRQKKSALLNASAKPLFNRVISGVYNPGSTIKPLVAVAALTEGIVTPETSILSIGYIELPNPYFPDKPSRFVDWKPQGWVNIYSALARSSNVYFYEVGGGFENITGLGIDRLHSWWTKLGLGEKTGVDFPGENTGFLPDPEEKEKRTGSIWRIGDTYNVSIGQGDLMVTPLQLLNYISAIANGGKLYQPHFTKDRGPAVLKDLTYLYPQIKEVQLGMEGAVSKSYGTASLLADLSFKVAAKTGSAQVENNTKTNAFFVGYAPEDNPQIAVLVLVENAKEGSVNAIPIAKDVLKWYYENRINK